MLPTVPLEWGPGMTRIGVCLISGVSPPSHSWVRGKAPRCSADPVEFPGSWEIGPLLGRGVVAAPTGPGTSFPEPLSSSEHLRIPFPSPPSQSHLHPHSTHSPKPLSAHTAGCTLHAVCLLETHLPSTQRKSQASPAGVPLGKKKLKMFENWAYYYESILLLPYINYE